MDKLLEFLCELNWGLLILGAFGGWSYSILSWRIIRLQHRLDMQAWRTDRMNENFIDLLIKENHGKNNRN